LYILQRLEVLEAAFAVAVVETLVTGEERVGRRRRLRAGRCAAGAEECDERNAARESRRGSRNHD
jgi:hypothetical protein